MFCIYTTKVIHNTFFTLDKFLMLTTILPSDGEVPIKVWTKEDYMGCKDML